MHELCGRHILLPLRLHRRHRVHSVCNGAVHCHARTRRLHQLRAGHIQQPTSWSGRLHWLLCGCVQRRLGGVTARGLHRVSVGHLHYCGSGGGLFSLRSRCLQQCCSRVDLCCMHRLRRRRLLGAHNRHRFLHCVRSGHLQFAHRPHCLLCVHCVRGVHVCGSSRCCGLQRVHSVRDLHVNLYAWVQRRLLQHLCRWHLHGRLRPAS